MDRRGSPHQIIFVDVGFDWPETVYTAPSGERRTLYLPPGKLMMVIGQRGIRLADLRAQRKVWGLIGWDEGIQGFVRSGNEGRRHLKISITGMCSDQSVYASQRLSDLLRGAEDDLI